MEDTFNDPGLIQEKGMRKTLSEPELEPLQPKKPNMRSRIMTIFNKKRQKSGKIEEPQKFEESDQNVEEAQMSEEKLDGGEEVEKQEHS